MHVPDGFLTAPVSLAAGAVAIGGIALCLRGARKELDERAVPLAGLASAFVFAAQMINFPVAAGTSGHLMGGALAAVLLGPWTGALCVTVVLTVQALLFADGGVTALGANIVIMAFATTFVGWLVVRGVRALLPPGRRSLLAAVFAGALASVPASALTFVGLFAVGGTVDVPLPTLVAAMLAVHVLIAVGEALITSVSVGSVLRTRPDLVHAARGLLPLPSFPAAVPVPAPAALLAPPAPPAPVVAGRR